MMLRVQHEDGRIETITLRGEVRVVNGHELDRLVTQDAEHFFTKAGFYDGWGMPIRCSAAEARELIEAVERSRAIAD